MQRENLVLEGLSSPRGPGSEDMDFNDVFGGPPRRFSMQEVRVRYSFGETRETHEEKTHSSWSEKPVFGEESGPRRWHQGDDFFDDIFMGSKETDRVNGFGPSPGSRIMSPSARPSSPKAEPFGTSSPTQFSLPAKLNKAVELPPFGSDNQYNMPGPKTASKSPLSSSPSSRFSSRSIKGQDHKTRRHDCQSPLSRQGSFSSHNSPLAKDNAEGFYFSVYKWARWGVSMFMPGLVAANSLKSKKGNGNYNDIMMPGATDCMDRKESLIQEVSYEVLQMKEGVSVEDNIVGGDAKKRIEKQVLLKKEKSLEKEAEPLRDLLLSDEDEQKPETNARTSGDEKKAKKHGKKTGPNKATVVKSGIVKEFVQIFDQNENRVTWNSAKSKENEEKKSDVSLKVNEDLKEKGQLGNRVSTNLEKNIRSESIHKESKIAPENLDDLLEDFFLVQELSDDTEKVTNDEDSEDTRAIDAKIQQWSFGKKENIRSLLSTLQYVLWRESGWRAVALVDLIEANGVKRAYQKALLRLHPDKLQQKGATFHQKYIAEKVFDILQEAWDHFNACSSLNL